MRKRCAWARPADAELRALYVDQELGCPDIAATIGCDPTTVHKWLKAAGIPTRPRGADQRQHFKPGQRLRLGIRHTPETIKKVGAASRARGAVPYLRNGKHWLKSERPELNPRWLGGATPERQEFYRSPEWKLACVAVWARANACCERCGLNARSLTDKRGAFHVHHIVSFQVRELRATVSNLALLCAGCHRFVHSAANVDREFLPSAEAEASVPDLFAMLGAAE